MARCSGGTRRVPGDAASVAETRLARRRCNTDPTDRGAPAVVSAEMTNTTDRDVGRSENSTIYATLYSSSCRRKRRLGSPSRQGLRKMLFDDNGERPKHNGLNNHLTARSNTCLFSRHGQPGHAYHITGRSLSLPPVQTLSDNVYESSETSLGSVDCSNVASKQDEASREWFWIWA